MMDQTKHTAPPFFPPRLLAAMKAAARASELTLSEYVRDALRQRLAAAEHAREREQEAAE